MPKALVTVATDGFRDYVELPDGRTLNLGSVSVLKLVSTLVQSTKLCRSALDAFLSKGSAVVKVDIGRLEEILKPKRARWAGKGLMSHGIREQSQSDMDGQIKTATDTAESTEAKFSGLVKAFNELYTQPSEATISSFRQASSEFLQYATGKVAVVDADAKYELGEFLENDPKALKLKEDIIYDIQSKPKYDHVLAKKLWSNWVDKGAESYSKKFDEDANALFPNALRDALSRDIADKERKLINEGEYEHLKTASGEHMSTAADDQDDTQGDKQASDFYKLAAEEVSIVNEGLIHLVAAKVEHALKVVQASEKRGGDIAKGDLHIISTQLSGITKTANMEDPVLRTGLMDLVRKADLVQSFFEG
jgi:acyl transferase domain-containing protein